VSNPVLAATEATFRSIEGNIDRFIKLRLSEYLDPARHRMAKFLGAGPEEIVFVPSCSHGLNTILRNLLWNEGDIIIGGKYRLCYLPVYALNFSLGPQQRQPTVP
jgi:selenocysteine lyase/cysteine desulfurase